MDHIHHFLKPWLYDFLRMRLLALLVMESYLLGAHWRLFSGPTKWHWDSFVWTYDLQFWLAGARPFEFALLVALFLFWGMRQNRLFDRLGAWLSFRSGYPASATAREVWTLWVMLFVVGFSSYCVLPEIIGATHSQACLVALASLMSAPFAVSFLLCYAAKPGSAAIASLTPRHPAHRNYDVLVKEDSFPPRAEQLRGLFNRVDRDAALASPQVREFLVRVVSNLFGSIEKFTGGAFRKERLVFADSSWDAFDKIVGLYIQQVAQVIATTIEPIEIGVRLSASAAASKLTMIDLPDDVSGPGFTATQFVVRVVDCVRSLFNNHEEGDLPRRVILVVSHVDCRRGQVYDLLAIFAQCREAGRHLKVEFIFVVNGQHGIGNVDVPAEILRECHYYVTDGNHWLRGGEGLGLIFLGGKLAEGAVTAEETAQAFRRRVEVLRSFAFSIESDCHDESGSLRVPPERLRGLELSTFAGCMDDVITSLEERRLTGEPPCRQIAEHNAALAQQFLEGLSERVELNQWLAACSVPQQTGIVVLYLRENPGPNLVIPKIRMELGRYDIQCKLLGSNHPDRTCHGADRLRFCFQDAHGSNHVFRLLNALQSIARDYAGQSI